MALIMFGSMVIPTQTVAQTNRSSETATFQSYDQRELVVGIQIYTGNPKLANDAMLQSTLYQETFWANDNGMFDNEPMLTAERRQYALTEDEWVGTTANFMSGTTQLAVDVIMASTDDYTWMFIVVEGTNKSTATQIINDTLRFEMWAIAPMGWGMMID